MINYGPGGGFGGWPGWGTGIGGGGGTTIYTPPGRGTDIGDPGPSVGPEITTTIVDDEPDKPWLWKDETVKKVDTPYGSQNLYIRGNDPNTAMYAMDDAKYIYDMTGGPSGKGEFMPNYAGLRSGSGIYDRGPFTVEGADLSLSGLDTQGQYKGEEFINRIGEKRAGTWTDRDEDEFVMRQTGNPYVILDGNVVTGPLAQKYGKAYQPGEKALDVTGIVMATQGNLGMDAPRFSRTAQTDSLRRALGFDTSYVAPPGAAAQPASSFKSPTNVRAYTPSPDAKDGGVKTRSRGRDLGEDTRIAQEVAAQRKRDSARIAAQKAKEAKAKAKKERGIKLAQEVMERAMKRAEQLKKDREFRKKQQKDKPKSHAFF